MTRLSLIVAAALAAALLTGCGPEEEATTQSSDTQRSSANGKSGNGSADSYAQQANENAIKGEDMPGNTAPDDPKRKVPPPR